jgi:hypothetical protein
VTLYITAVADAYGNSAHTPAVLEGHPIPPSLPGNPVRIEVTAPAGHLWPTVWASDVREVDDTFGPPRLLEFEDWHRLVGWPPEGGR